MPDLPAITALSSKPSIVDIDAGTVLLRACEHFFWNGRAHRRHDRFFGLFPVPFEDAENLLALGYAKLAGRLPRRYLDHARRSWMCRATALQRPLGPH